MSPDTIHELTARLLVGAAEFIAQGRVDETSRGWLVRADRVIGDAEQGMEAVAGALAMAMTLALFTPSASGSTAFDRLARQRKGMDADEATVLQSLRRAQFRLLRVDAPSSDGVARLRDLASNAVLDVMDDAIGPETCGMPLVGWLMSAGAGRHIFATDVTPLDDAGLAVATAFTRPGRASLVNPLRCAEAVFRHVVRHGTPEIPGLNRPLPGEDDDLPEELDDLDRLALQWAEPGAERDPEDIQYIRTLTSMDSILAALASAANTREHRLAALSDAYAAMAFIQLETVHRRSAAGSGSIRLDTVAAALNEAIAGGEQPPGAREVFEGLRRRLGKAPGDASKDAELDRLIGRIQALRAKTVEQGCTEQEALSAAEKVAELLDRYGLSLSELDMSRQACEGSAVETGRRRTGPIDDCVPSIAAFFDCRVWGEKSAEGMLRYVFFGLPADVLAARYLYDLVEQAFATETARFRAGATYADMPSGTRRTASNSFQVGLSRGIGTKLHTLREARETTLRHASGRDLVVVKEDLVDAELAALGLRLRSRTRSGGRRILRDIFEQGHETGLGFEYTPGVAHEG